jgi:hypothetical protein
MYIPGEDNMVADALSRVPNGAFPGESPEGIMNFRTETSSINATLSITTDASVLRMIQDSYKADEFCKKLIASSTLGVSAANGLWYIGD